jgi:sulfoxide reductase heme-binding subunit YedZ
LKRITIIKGIVFAAALIPAAALAYGFYALYYGIDPGALTANPGDYLTDQTGTWTISFLMISLGVTPLRRLTGWNEVIRLRRMLGLFAFFYGTLHLLTWIVFINFFDVDAMVQDVIKRPFITIGMGTWLILFVLTLTSNQLAVRTLKRRWQTLHRLAYVAGLGGVIHFWWLVKADTTEPRRWALTLALLLGLRMWWAYWKRRNIFKGGKKSALT